jgi:hypothetical protein
MYGILLVYLQHCIYLSCCCHACDLNILGTRMEASFPLSRNGVWQPCDAVEAQEVQATAVSHLEAIPRHIEP